jgi:hypothetical protein
MAIKPALRRQHDSAFGRVAVPKIPVSRREAYEPTR